MIDARAVKSALQILEGTAAVDTATALDMRIVEFEAKSEEQKRKFNLHLQCCWRLQDDHGILTGSADHYLQAESIEQTSTKAATLQDVKMKSFIERQTKQAAVVNSVTADEYAGAKIRFSNGDVLIIFPSGSEGEAWRLFEGGHDNDHFVAYADDADFE